MEHTAEDTFNRLKSTPLDFHKVNIDSIEVDGLDHHDYPDYVDAYACYAEFDDGTLLDDDQLDQLNADRTAVYDAIYNDYDQFGSILIAFIKLNMLKYIFIIRSK